MIDLNNLDSKAACQIIDKLDSKFIYKCYKEKYKDYIGLESILLTRIKKLQKYSNIPDNIIKCHLQIEIIAIEDLINERNT